MRILHTSDWHLGRSFHREDLLGAQAAFVDHLVATVRAERIDAVVVSGDLYDRALPPVDAVALCNEALRRLAAERVRTVVISGNHDSARRLGFAADLIDAAGIHLRTDPARAAEPVLLPAGDGGPGAAVYAIPYLEPDAVAEQVGADARGHGPVLSAVMHRVRADIATRSERIPSVVLAHAVVVGGEACDSERDISVGGVSSVPVSTFDGADYVALGHLHGAQQVAPHVRYSGSPLAYSFSEEHQRKSSWLVDLAPGRPVTAERIDAPVPRPLRRLRGRLDDLLGRPHLAAHEGSWIHATLVDAVRPREAMDLLRARFPHVLVLAFEPEGAAATLRGGARLTHLSDLEIATRFVGDVRSPANAAEIALLQQAFEDQRRAEAAV